MCQAHCSILWCPKATYVTFKIDIQSTVHMSYKDSSSGTACVYLTTVVFAHLELPLRLLPTLQYVKPPCPLMFHKSCSAEEGKKG